MRKLKEVLRLHSLGLKQQQISRSCLIAQSTVHQYLKAATAAGVSWPLPPDWNERQLEEAVSGAPQPAVAKFCPECGRAFVATPATTPWTALACRVAWPSSRCSDLETGPGGRLRSPGRRTLMRGPSLPTRRT